MKSYLIISLAGFIFLFSSCKSWVSVADHQPKRIRTKPIATSSPSEMGNGNRVIVYSDKPISNDDNASKVIFRGDNNTVTSTQKNSENASTDNKSVLIIEGDGVKVNLNSTDTKDHSVKKNDTLRIVGSGVDVNINTKNVIDNSQDSHNKHTIIAEKGSNLSINNSDFTDNTVRSRVEGALLAGDGLFTYDFPTMEAYYLPRVQAGDADAAYYLGKISHLQSKFTEAITYWEKGAAKNHLECLLALGDMYYAGFPNQDSDITKAKIYYAQAAKLGSEVAEEKMKINTNFQEVEWTKPTKTED